MAVSTFGGVEEALRKFDLASERVGYALEHANRDGATPAQRAAAVAASQERNQKRSRLLEAIHEHAAAQHQAGLEMGRAEGRRAG